MELRFIDSYKHLTHPLDSLVNYLFNKDTNIQSIRENFSSLFQHFNDKTAKLLSKGVFPYDYMDEDCKNKFKQKELPDIKYFHSSLNNTKCSVGGSDSANEIYNYFGCEEIRDYNNYMLRMMCYY